MKSFRTEIVPKKSDWDIQIDHSIVLLGSCFTDNIGAKLTKLMFSTFVNPFGTLFSPFVIHNLIRRAVEEKLFVADDFFEKDGMWHNWELNNAVSSNDLDENIRRLNGDLKSLQKKLTTCSYLILTLGTAWVYKLKEDNKIVANCHKMDGNLFEKECLSYDYVRSLLNDSVALVQKTNPAVKVITTLSPVRHWKDGPIQNSKSKAILRLALDSTSNENVQYFPAYEIQMDDLRDYRFYRKDMLHPNKQAIDYIFDQFSSTYFNEETAEIMDRIRSFVNDSSHIPQHKESDAYRQFSAQLIKKQRALFNDFPILKERIRSLEQ